MTAEYKEWHEGMSLPPGAVVLWSVADEFRARLLRTDGEETIYRIKEELLVDFLRAKTTRSMVLVGTVPNIGSGKEEPPKPMEDVALRKTLLTNVASLASDLASLDIPPKDV